MRIIESRKLTAVLRNVKIINYNSIEETRLRDLSQTIIITLDCSSFRLSYRNFFNDSVTPITNVRYICIISLSQIYTIN